QLVPAVTLSAEAVSLISSAADADQVDFGVDVTVNESDSLFNVEVLPGVRVRSITANGPAANAGIQVGDTILRVNDTATNHPDALALLASSSQSSNSYAFTVQRNTQVFEATVIARTLDTNPAPVSLYRIDPLATRAGYRSELVEIGEDGPIAAARVVEIFPRSPLPAANISVGDLLLALDGVYLNSAQDLVTRLNRDYELGDSVRLTRYRDSDLAEVEVELWDPGRRISRIALGPLFRYESSLSPDSTSVSLLDLWLFSLYSFQQQEGERSHSLLGLINFSSDAGELIEESN
ncbi:MAG: PDZ domain-containing protein, partial [Pseudomonadales bacterium]|nr:PDZ domain-containing protein [Pseudomonadales bacterium]